MANAHPLYTLLLLLLCGPLSAQTTDPGFDLLYAQQLQQALNDAFASGTYVGISAAVVVPGQGQWVGVRGNSQPGQPIAPNMRFGIASNSKSFVAGLCLRLADQGLIDLDAPIGNYLAATHPHLDPAITTRQLLNHQSGLFDFYNDQPQAQGWIDDSPYTNWTPEAVLATIGAPFFAPGTSFRYSNTNFLVAGMVCNAVTGKPMRQLLAEEIAAPLGLSSLAYPTEGDPVFEAPFAMLISNGSPALDPTASRAFLSFIQAAGGIWCTAADLAQWYQHALTGNFLSPASRAELRRVEPWSSYSLGMRARNYGGTSLHYHAGAWGYRSYALFDAETGISVAVLSNLRSGGVTAIANALLNAARDQLPKKPSDLAVSISHPSGHQCAEVVNAQALFRNVGNGPVGSISYTSYLDGDCCEPQTDILLFTPLLPGEALEVAVPINGWAPGQAHRFTVEATDQGYAFDNSPVTYFQVQAPELLPATLSETFEQPYGQLPPGWHTDQPHNLQDWRSSHLAGSGGALCRNFYSDGNNGRQLHLDLPPIRLQPGQVAQLQLDYAYASYSGSQRDSLEVWVSTDCGQQFHRLWRRGQASLATAPNTTASFRPSSSAQWAQATITAPDTLQGPTAIFRLRTVNGFGNNLWIDNVTAAAIQPVSTAAAPTLLAAHLWPNPTAGAFRVTLAEPVSAAELRVYDALGQEVARFAGLSGTSFALTLPAHLPVGVYVVEVSEQGQQRAVGRLVLGG